MLIAIPTLNECENIKRIITELLDGAPEGTVLVVVDGGSLDDTQDIVERIASGDHRVRLIHNPDRLQSAGINRVVGEFGEDFEMLVRADAHADYPNGFVAALVAEQQRTGAAAVGIAMESRANRGFAAGVAAAQNSFLGTGGSAHRVGASGRWVDHAHNALFRLDAFRSTGGYDPCFRHNEDAELDHRLRLAGHRIWLTDRTRMIYHPRTTPGALWRQYMNYGYGRASTVLKHSLRPRARQLAPLAVPPAAVLAVLGVLGYVISGWSTMLMAAVPFALWVGVCLAGGMLLAARARRREVLWAGPAAMISHFAWALGFFRRLIGGDAREKRRRRSSGVARRA